MIKHQEKLSGVNPKLVQVVLLAATICPVDISIGRITAITTGGFHAWRKGEVI